MAAMSRVEATSPTDASGASSAPVVSAGASTNSEFVAVVLASSVGTRLFPMTTEEEEEDDLPDNSRESKDQPTTTPLSKQQHPQYYKHGLPVAGVSVLQRLLLGLVETASFESVVVCLHPQDVSTTVAQLQEGLVGSTITPAWTWSTRPPTVASTTTAKAKEPQQPMQTSSSSQETSETAVVMGYLVCGTTVVTVVRLASPCLGSAQALLQLEQLASSSNADSQQSQPVVGLSPNSHLVVVPGDLVLYDSDCLAHAMQTHRQQQPAGAACTLLLTDVGEVEEQTGLPLSESAKAKRGGLPRDEQDIEYMALSTIAGNSNVRPSLDTTTPRVARLVWKQLKVDVENDDHGGHNESGGRANPGGEPSKEGGGGLSNTFQLVLPKARLTESPVRVQTSWSDMHVYLLSPWVRKLLQARNCQSPSLLLSIQEDLLPLLIARQYQGVQATLSKRRKKQSGAATSNDPSTSMDMRQQLLEQQALSLYRQQKQHRFHSLKHASLPAEMEGSSELSPAFPAMDSTSNTPRSSMHSSQQQLVDAGFDDYSVVACVHPSSTAVLRANSIASYLYANKELVHRQQSHQPRAGGRNYLALPAGSTLKAKVNSVFLPESNPEAKVNLKNVTVGRHVRLGAKCRLNNTLLMDHVTVGDNVVLQNTVVGEGCTIGDNCNLNDCQVGRGKNIPKGTQEKGESFLVDGTALES